MIELGDLVPLELKVRNAASNPADAGGVQLVVTLPDGTTLTGTFGSAGDLTIEHPTLGEYACDVRTTAIGQHRYRWTTTGANAGVQADVFNVEDEGPCLVSLDEAREALQGMKPCTKTADLERLRQYILVASTAIEGDLNRVLTPRTITETHQTGGAIALRRGPAQQILSVDVDGQTAAAGTWRMRTEGILETRYGWATSSPWDAGVVTVTYRAGDPVISPVVRKVCLAAVRRMWQLSTQTPTLPPEDLVSDDLSPVIGTLTTLELDAYELLRRMAIA